MFDTLNWDDLRVFLHAARAGNLSQTAKRLRLDHSTVSRRIAQLEASLGIAVFERHRTGLKLNGYACRQLLEFAQRFSGVGGVPFGQPALHPHAFVCFRGRHRHVHISLI